MKPVKFLFNAGDDIPAESFNTIDPDNISPQSTGYLTGGTSHSALSVFQTLGAGSNDGKFKINVDGSVYNNVAVDFNSPDFVNDINQTTENATSNVSASDWRGQSFTLTANSGFIKKIRLRLQKIGSPSGNFNISLYAVSGDNPTGSPLKTISVLASSISSSMTTYEYDFNVALSKSTKYVLVFSLPNGNPGFTAVYLGIASSNVYGGGTLISSNNSGSSWSSVSSDIWFQVDTTTIDSFSVIATRIQTAIRTATSKTETVIYDTDKFKITSSTLGRSSQILKLMSPSTGTDISGAGATPYLDMADNATEVQGDGEEWNLVRLDEYGKIVKSLVQYKKTSGVTTRDLSTASGTQTIAHGLSGIPKKIRLTGLKGAGAGITYETSQGLYDNGANKRIYASNVYAGQSTTSAIYFRPDNSVTEQSQTGVVSVDDTNITITWTKLNSPTGTAQILWEAEL